MGQQQTKTNLRKSRQFKVHMKADIAHYGEAEILKNKKGQMQIKKSLTITSNKQMMDIQKKIEYVKESHHPNICPVIKYDQDDTQLFCANFSSLYLFFEFYESNLEQQVLDRWQHYNRFNNKQLYQIMKEILLPLEYLHSNNMAHGDIRGYNVLIDNSNDTKKISCIPCFFKAESQYIQFLENLARPKLCTLAPEQLRCLRVNEKSPKYDPKKADVFQAGFCILQAAALTSCARVYNWHKFNINKEELDSNIEKITKLYSKSLVDIIKTCLVLDPKKRPSLREIKSMLTNPRICLNPPKQMKEVKRNENSLKSDMNEVKQILKSNEKASESFNHGQCKRKSRPLSSITNNKLNLSNNDIVFSQKYNNRMHKNFPATPKLSLNYLNQNVQQVHGQTKSLATFVYKKRKRNYSESKVAVDQLNQNHPKDENRRNCSLGKMNEKEQLAPAPVAVHNAFQNTYYRFQQNQNQVPKKEKMEMPQQMQDYAQVKQKQMSQLTNKSRYLLNKKDRFKQQLLTPNPLFIKPVVCHQRNTLNNKVYQFNASMNFYRRNSPLLNKVQHNQYPRKRGYMNLLNRSDGFKSYLFNRNSKAKEN